MKKARTLTAYRDGVPVGTRTTRKDYVAAVYVEEDRPVFSGVASFHTSVELAERAAARERAFYNTPPKKWDVDGRQFHGTVEVLTDIR